MMTTSDAITNLASAFCRLSKPEYKEFYIKALHSLATMARAEQLLEMQQDFDKCTNGPTSLSSSLRSR